MKKCYIVILNYKGWEDTLECIRSVFNSDYTHFTVIVVDNFSQNQSLENISRSLVRDGIRKKNQDAPLKWLHLDAGSVLSANPSLFPDLVMIQNDRNRGFAAGNNVALRTLLGLDGAVWLLNPDMVAKPDTLETLLHCLEKSQPAIIGCVTMSFDDKNKILFYGGGKVNYLSANVTMIDRVEDIKELTYISGGSLFTEIKLFESNGLLPEEYFLYWEETDWCFSAVRKGIQLLVCLDAICYDKVSTTIGKGYIADYFYTRNGLLFLKKFKKMYLAPAIIIILGRAARKAILGKFSNARGLARGALDFLTKSRYENK